MQPEQNGSKEKVFHILDTHLAAGLLLSDFSLPESENSPEDTERLNVDALIRVIQNFLKDFPYENPNGKEKFRGSARFRLTIPSYEKLYTGKNFDWGGISRATIWLLDLAAQGVANIEFDLDAFEIKETDELQELGVPWKIDFRKEVVFNQQEEIDTKGLATVHFPQNFAECVQHGEHGLKIMLSSSVFGTAYALDWLDRYLKERMQIEDGIFGIHAIYANEAAFQNGTQNLRKIAFAYQTRFANFYDLLLKLPDVGGGWKR